MPDQVLDEAQIRNTAYLIWIDEGQPDGRDEEHWARAIEMLTAAAPKVKKPRKAAAKKPAAKAAPAKKAPAAKKPAAKKAAAGKAAKPSKA